MTLPGLHAVGLQDWPTWYRAANPDYFASSDDNSQPIAQWPRAGACAGGSCCGPAASNMVLAQKGVQELRNPGQNGTVLGERERGAKTQRLGQQVLKKLRGMHREDVRHVESEKRGRISRNVILERAAVKDTMAWEQERGSDAGVEDAVEKKGAVTKEKLVDI